MGLNDGNWAESKQSAVTQAVHTVMYTRAISFYQCGGDVCIPAINIRGEGTADAEIKLSSADIKSYPTLCFSGVV